MFDLFPMIVEMLSRSDYFTTLVRSTTTFALLIFLGRFTRTLTLLSHHLLPKVESTVQRNVECSFRQQILDTLLIEFFHFKKANLTFQKWLYCFKFRKGNIPFFGAPLLPTKYRQRGA